jgi:hypothetical protein
VGSAVFLYCRAADFKDGGLRGSLARSELESLLREIASADAQIEELLYNLYGIMEEERTIIERSG